MIVVGSYQINHEMYLWWKLSGVLTPYDYDTVEEGKIVVWYSRGYQFLSLFSNTMKSVDWEKEPEFIALNKSCVKGGADKRALPHYLRTLLSTQKKEILEMIGENEDTQCKDLNPKEHHMELNHVHRQGRNELRAELRDKLQVSKIIEE